MLKKSPCSIAFIGETDHGKSTLVGRLMMDTDSLPSENLKDLKKISKELDQETALAYLTDQLEEERTNNCTIDTTQIHLRSPCGGYILIDTPGHLEFLKNMMTGTASADAAILVIDATEGIKPQTQRHTFLVGFLGISHLLVAVNKMDLINYSQKKFKEIVEELRHLLFAHGIKNFSVVPVSAKEGINVSRRSLKMTWCKGPTLLKAMRSLRRNRGTKNKPFRFPVQDVYEVDGQNIIVGRIASGDVRQGERVILLPSLKESKIDALKVFNRRIKKAETHESIGITLCSFLTVRRGNILCNKENCYPLAERFAAKVFWLSDQPLPLHRAITFRCATQEGKCVIENIEKKIDPSTLRTLEENANEIKQNEVAFVSLKTDRALVVENFSFIDELGRFVLEDNSRLAGAGIITGNAQAEDDNVS